MSEIMMEMSMEQVDEHRLEIENRIRNIFWTVSGDYSLEIKPDLEAFARSRYIALYDAIKQGAFAKQFDADELSIYMMKKMKLGGKEKPLLSLVQLCVDAAVYPVMRGDRKGIDEVRLKAFHDLLYFQEHDTKKGQRPDFFDTVRTLIMKRFIEEMRFSSDIGTGLQNQTSQTAVSGSVAADTVAADTVAADTVAAENTASAQESIVRKADEKPDANMPDAAWAMVMQVADEISALSHAGDTKEIIAVIDRIYNRFYDTKFEEEHGGLQAVLNVSPMALASAAYEECWSDEQAEKIIEKFLRMQRKSLFSLEIKDEDKGQYLLKKPAREFEYTDEDAEAAKKVANYVAMNYGKSYLSDQEAARLNERICRGVHRGCRLHLTDGIIGAPVLRNYQYRMCEMQLRKNEMYYYGNHRVIKQNISILAEMLNKALVLRKEADTQRARYGTLIPNRLWKLGRTDDDKFFDKKEKVDSSDFVVDILLDSSGSQLKRQQQIAVQGYIISSALSEAGIPHRVTSFCTFWDYTVLQRFRDYDDDKEKDFHIFEYRSSANNRDGLAVKAIYDGLLAREEDHKILLILSDGRPNDLGREHAGTIGVPPYVGEDAIRDTGFEIRRARAQGISVLGIFAGDGDDLAAEKKIYGKDFAYIRNITNFSHVVGTYLKRQLDET